MPQENGKHVSVTPSLANMRLTTFIPSASRVQYLAPLLPADPEKEKAKKLALYHKELAKAEAVFDLKMQKRYQCLLKSVS